MDGPEIRVTSTMFDTKRGGTFKRIFLFEQVYLFSAIKFNRHIKYCIHSHTSILQPFYDFGSRSFAITVNPTKEILKI